MNAKFSPGENGVYVLSQQGFPYLSLNRPLFEKAGINEEEAENAVKAALPPAFASLAVSHNEPVTPVATQPAAPADIAPQPTVKAGAEAAVVTTPPQPPPTRAAVNPQLFRSYTRVELAAGQVPNTPFGRILANSYSPNGGWYVMVIPGAFQMQGAEGSTGTTHYTPYSYDRHVPLGFYGAPFAPGTYRGRVEPVDIAATLASVLGINQPSAAVGQVLTQALKPAPEYVYPREAVRRPVRATHRKPTAQGDSGKENQ